MNVCLLRNTQFAALIEILVSQDLYTYVSTLGFKVLPSLSFMPFTLLSRLKENTKYSLERSKVLTKWLTCMWN